MASGDTRTNNYLDIAANGTRADLPTETCCETRTQTLIRGVAERIIDVEEEVDEMKNNPDVVDIVATYADLQNYDTSTLTDKDVIRVLSDSTHDGMSTYYRYSTSTGEFTYIGGSASNLTVVQTTGTSTTNVMSQNATTGMVYADPATKTQIQLGNSTSSNLNTVSIGNNIAAEGTRAIAIGDRTDDTIVTASGASAISIGVNNSSTGGNGIAIGVRANATGDGSIAWGTYATSSGLYALATHYQSEASGKYSSAIGPYAKALRDSSMAFGTYSEANGVRGIAVGERATTDSEGSNNMAIGYYASATGNGSMAVGLRASSTAPNALALGAYSSATQQGEMNIGTTNTTYGYNNSNYRLLSGIYDPQSDHDAATKGYVDANAGGPTVVQTTGQSTTDVMSQKAVTDTIDDLSTVEYVNLTITGTSGQAFLTSADKTTAEIVALVADDKKIIFKLNYTATGTPINPGVYEFPLTADFNVGGGHAIGGAAAGWVSSKPAVYVYIQNGVDGRTGTIEIKLCATPTDVQAVDSKVGDLANLTTTDKTSTVAAINEIVTTIGNIEAALNVINNGEN